MSYRGEDAWQHSMVIDITSIRMTSIRMSTVMTLTVYSGTHHTDVYKVDYPIDNAMALSE